MITQVWNAAFEAIPADNDQISEGALRIRNLKRDIRERMEIDHDWDDITDAGKHKQLTLVDPLPSDPATVVDQGYVYSKNVSAVVELFWKDEAGNVLQLTAAGKIPGTALASDAVFPTGTKMLFQQTNAPTGWTKDTTHNDKALRVVSGAAGSGGVTAFSGVFGASKVTGGHTLTVAETPAHDHFTVFNGASTQSIGLNVDPTDAIYSASGGGLGNADYILQGANARPDVGWTSESGGGQAHTHTLSLDLQFVDIIIATKN